MVEQAALAVTDADGKFHNKDHQAEVLARIPDLPPNVQTVAREQQAKQLVAAFIKRRTPKRGANGSLYSDFYVLSLGTGKRVWMKYARADDLNLWGGQDAANLSRVARASADKQEYIGERIFAFREHPDDLLGDVERIEFGYALDEDSDVEDDDTDPDW